MKMLPIKNNVYYLGSKDINRKLFDQLIPLPQGTTYNSYLVVGSEKTALVDTMYPKKIHELIEKLDAEGIKKVDYIIANHGEQDHSGALPTLVSKYPEAKIVTNAKCKDIVQNLLHLDEEKFHVVGDGDELSLGDKTVKFILAPWVHWPDTMFSYLKEDKMLFTCDFLGAHYTKNDLFADYTDELVEAAKRYYAEIIMPFRNFAKKYTQMVKGMEVDVIMPSHGPVYDKPDFILNLYDLWTSDKVENKVVIPYVSMYESTKMLVDELSTHLRANNIDVKLFDLVNCDEGELTMELVDAATVVFGASMVLAGPHPAAVTAAYLVNAIRPKVKYYAIVGSYGWGGKLTETIESMLSIIKPEKLDYVVVKGRPTEEDLQKARDLAALIAQKHKTL